MQGASVDPRGRLRVLDALASPTAQANGRNAGFTFETDGRLTITTAPSGQGVANAGFNASNQGRLWCAVAPVSISQYIRGWPMSDRSVAAYVDQPVPDDAVFNEGIAMDSNGVYMTTTAAPPPPTVRFDLTQFPLDPRITFSRNSVGTYWDQNGVMQIAAVNEPRPYREMHTVSVGIPNQHYTYLASASPPAFPAAGNCSQATGSLIVKFSKMSLEGNDLSPYFSTLKAGDFISLGSQEGKLATDPIPNTDMWQCLFESFPVLANGDYRITARRVEVVANSVRYDTLGLMIEEAATNKVLHSSDFAQSAWTKFGTAYIESDVAMAPNGTMTADRLVFGSDPSSGDGMFQSPACAEGENIINAFFMRSPVAGTVRLVANSNLSDPVAQVCNVTDRWQRFSVEKLAAAGTTIMSCQIDNGGGSTLASVEIWGADQHNEKVLTSHIPTTTVTRTRAVDIAYVQPEAQGWWNPVEGTIRCISYTYKLNTGSAKVVWDVNKASPVFGDNVYTTYGSTGANFNLSPSGSPVEMVVSIPNSSQRVVSVSGMKANDANMAVNGVLGTPDTVCAMPSGAATMSLGSASWGSLNGGNNINGYIAILDYWNTRLTDGQMQELAYASQ